MEVPILKGKLKFKEGRSKWKNRFVYFLRPETSTHYLLLYVLKSEEEYAKLSNATSGDAHGGVMRTAEVEPHDEIFGIEYGHRIDKNPNSIMLVGRTSVCFVGHSDFRRMINWSDKLQRELSDVYYHATLCEVTALGGCDGCASCCSTNGRIPKTYGSISCSSDSSCASSFSASSIAAAATSGNSSIATAATSTQGQVVASLVQAGTLHIEKSRICFVSEPVAGTCKLIGSWDIKFVRHFGTTPNDYFCLEIDVADSKGLIMYTFKSHRVHEISRDVEAVLSDRLPPSLLILNATASVSTSRQPMVTEPSDEKSKPCLPASSAVQIPPRRIMRRRRRSRDHTGHGTEPSEAATNQLYDGNHGNESSLRIVSRRASTASVSSDMATTCANHPRRRHSNCHHFRPKPLASSPPSTIESAVPGSISSPPAASALSERRLRGDEDTSAYTVFVPPARLSPTVIRRRESGQGSNGEPQRSVSFRLSNFVSRATGGHEKRGSFLHRLIHKRRSRSDCDLGRETLETPSILQPPQPPALRVALPPRSIAGLGPSSNSSNGSYSGNSAGPMRSRMRPRPLPSPGVEDLRLFPGSFQTSSLQRQKSANGTCPACANRCPQRSASGTELCTRPTDYHEFYPAGEALRHSSASLVTGGSSTTTTSTSPFCVSSGPSSTTSAQATQSSNGSVLAPTGSVPAGSSEVPLSPIREDLRSSGGTCTSSALCASSSFNRRRTTSSSSGVSSGGCASSVIRFPSSSSGSTAPSPPVQMRRFRLHTQTSMEASLGSLLPLESPQEVTPGTATDSATSAASSPDVQGSFLPSSSAPAQAVDGHSPSGSGQATSSSAPSNHATMCSCSMPWYANLRSIGDLPVCGTAPLHHYVNLTPGGSCGGSSALSAAFRERERELAHTGYVNLDLRGEINFGYPTTTSAASGICYGESASTMPSTPASSTRASLVLAEDSRSMNFAPMDMRPGTKMDLNLGVSAPPRPLNYAHLQWMPNHRSSGPASLGTANFKSHTATNWPVNGAHDNACEDGDEDGPPGGSLMSGLCSAVCEIDLGSSKRDGYIEIDPVKTFAVNAVKVKTLEDDRADEVDGTTDGRAPKRNNSMKNGSTRRVPRFRFSSRKSYESTTAS